MPKNQSWKLVAGFIAVAGLFTFAMERLMRDRLDRGDIYPAYSTLRTDPVGAKALFDALSIIPEVEVSRYMRPLEEIGKLPSGTFFYLGDLEESWKMRIPQDTFQTLERWMREGGRLIITLEPERYSKTWTKERRREQVRLAEDRARDKRRKEREEGEDESSKKKENEWEDVDVQGRRFVDFSERLGIAVEREPLSKNFDGDPETAMAFAPGKDWPPLPWQSVQYFEPQSDDIWKAVVYRDEGEEMPVVVERSFGAGSLVLVSDSYLFSNEGLWRDQHPEFISWLIAGNRRIYFDEGHFGVTERPGVASLARQYGLYGGVYMLALLAALFVWRNARSLAPTPPEPAAGSSLGEESSLAMVNLLKRSLAPVALVPLCIEEWKRTGGARAKRHSAEIEEALREEQAPNKRPEVVRIYQRIQHILLKKPKS